MVPSDLLCRQIQQLLPLNTNGQHNHHGPLAVFIGFHSWPWPLLPVLAPTTTCVFATSSCHYTGTCYRSLQLSHCGYGHYRCLPLPLAVVLGGATEHPNSSGSLCISPVVLINDRMVVDAVDPNGLSWQTTMPPWIWCCHTFCTWPAAGLGEVASTSKILSMILLLKCNMLALNLGQRKIIYSIGKINSH